MRAAVLGSPIAHSLSPVIHRAAYRALGLDWSYEALDITPLQLPKFLADLDESWAGLSLTMPLKETAIEHLDEVDELAIRVRAVNTVLPTRRGLLGTNTDVYGMVHALNAAGLEVCSTATILGAGATARSAVAAAAALGVTSINVCARRPAAALDVCAVAAEFGVTASARDLEPAADLLRADLVISTLPGDIAAHWVPFVGDGVGALQDVSYHPWPTPLAGAWPTKLIASGRDLLLWQAAEQVHLMTGRDAPVLQMRAALDAT
jgi:shikimate dehydrogenase